MNASNKTSYYDPDHVSLIGCPSGIDREAIRFERLDTMLDWLVHTASFSCDSVQLAQGKTPISVCKPNSSLLDGFNTWMCDHPVIDVPFAMYYGESNCIQGSHRFLVAKLDSFQKC